MALTFAAEPVAAEAELAPVVEGVAKSAPQVAAALTEEAAVAVALGSQCPP
jgi:hypothetical protein